MNIRNILFSVCLAAQLLMIGGVAEAGQIDSGDDRKEYASAYDLFGKGMYEKACDIFTGIYDRSGDDLAWGWKVLCEVTMRSPVAKREMDYFISECPRSPMIPRIRYAYAGILFDGGDYIGASELLEQISKRQIFKKDRTEFLFKRAYCDFEMRNYDRAMIRFKDLEALPESDFTAPSRYALGYMNYQRRNFSEAADWFAKSASDSRFASVSGYFVLECKFMEKDYGYVVTKGPGLLEKVPADRRTQVSRFISEAYLVLGDGENARLYYEMNQVPDSKKDREDFFYSGSVLYAVKDYKGAISSYSKMSDRTDSLGQIANYHLGYCYIKTKDKVSAMGAFKDASSVSFDREMAKDAFFNYAKLTFDLNNDSSAFYEYLKRYPEVKRGDRIYSYMALAALYNRDYAGAVEAYDNIDEFDTDMRLNYMKANYLRASQLISSGSFRAAVPYLKAAAYYSDKRDMFNQLSRFWLAESYYRSGETDQALSLFKELYNVSALYGEAESYLLPYNMAWCYFRKSDYKNAEKWFTEYLGGRSVVWRKEALTRRGDCLFMQKFYKEASDAYGQVLSDYFDVNDIYPYYQAAMSYGLSGNDSKKCTLLENVLKASPKSSFYPDAKFELGKVYVRLDKTAKAEAVFNDLNKTTTDSTFVARSLIELGMIARNDSRPQEAIACYKRVIEQLPMSGYSEDALVALESLYQSLNDPDSYLAYIERIGRGSMKTDDEKEMMIFNAAEQIFLSEDYAKAIVSLESYMKRYPSGALLPKAQFYMAESLKYTGQPEKACDWYEKVMKTGQGSYLELSVLNFSNLSYQLQRYDDAFSGYSMLLETAVLENNRYAARLGMMRSAYSGRDYKKAVDCADIVLSDQRTTGDLKTEAQFILAKSCLATSQRDRAFGILKTLAKDPSTPQGAEAAYMLIVDSYDRGDFSGAENLVYDFADSGTGQTYWLAKAFIVLGDSFVERDNLEQARATYESILSGYKAEGDDDVVPTVKSRLEKLESLEEQASMQM